VLGVEMVQVLGVVLELMRVLGMEGEWGWSGC